MSPTPIETTTASDSVNQEKERLYKLMPDFVSPDLPSRCTWKEGGCPMKTPHTVWPL